MKTIFILLLFLIFGAVVHGAKKEEAFNIHFQQNDYQVKFERIELGRFNKDLLKSASITTYKYNRTQPVVNATFEPKVDAGNDLISVPQAYKFMSNEYRYFPLRFAVGLCEAVTADVAGLSELKRCGNFTGCNIMKGIKYHLCNWYPDSSKFPPLIPNGQYKIEVQLVYLSVEAAVINLYLTVDRPIV